MYQNVSRTILIGALSTCTNSPSIAHVMHPKFVSHYKMSPVTSVWMANCMNLPSQHECGHCRAGISASLYQYHHLCIYNNLPVVNPKAVVSPVTQTLQSPMSKPSTIACGWIHIDRWLCIRILLSVTHYCSSSRPHFIEI